MVVALGPGKFYGSSLPRPRFYTDVKLNNERVDPPVPVLDAFMSWAEEAHWSMGGLNPKRLRLQGRIEGNVKKLRAEHDRSVKKKDKESAGDEIKAKFSKNLAESPASSPPSPPAPFVVKRKRRILIDESDEEEEGGIKRGPARKLWDDFDKVAEESGMKKEVSGSEGVATRTRSQRSESGVGNGNEKVVSKGRKLKLKGQSKGNIENGVRVSPRLAKRG